MEIQPVTFHKGINSDLDQIYLDGTTYIDLVNGRLEPLSEGKYVVRNANGIKTYFSITAGYVPISFCVISGILFILSINDQNVCELGYFNGTSYLVFNNLKPNHVSNPGPFRSSLFGYTINSEVSMIGRVIFDGSINLYLCDGVNPNYVVNSGVDLSGNVTSSVYTPDSFSGKLRQFLGTSKIPSIDRNLSYVKNGGALKPGSYLVFIRYSDHQYNKTPFIGYSTAFLVSNGDDSNFSAVPLDDKDLSTTNKMLLLTIDNIDIDYKYIEIAYVRYFGLASNISYQVKSIADSIEIDGNTSMVIALTGREKTADITIEQLYEEIPQTQACSDHEIINDHYWGVGWKKSKRDGEKTKEFFKRIVPNAYFDGSTTSNLNKGIGDSFSKNVGYFAEQIYQFVGFFIYNDMSRSELYPLAGYYDSTNKSYNNSGYVKMPRRPSDKLNNPLAIKFSSIEKASVSYFDDGIHGYVSAYEYLTYNSNSDEFKDVKYIQVLRSDKISNLLYQGLVVPTTFRFKESGNVADIGGYGIEYNQVKNKINFPYSKPLTVSEIGAEGTKSKYLGKALVPQTYSGGYHYPFFAGIAPVIEIGNDNRPIGAFISEHTLDQDENVRMALFSPDFMFNDVSKVGTGQKLWIEAVSAVTNAGTLIYGNTSTCKIYPSVIGSKMAPAYISGTRKTGYVSVSPVPEDLDSGPNNFISRIRDYFAVGKYSGSLPLYTECVYLGESSHAISMPGTYTLRSNRCPRYIGLEFENEKYGSVFDVSNFYYINLYLSPNDETFYNNIKSKTPLMEEYFLVGIPLIKTSLATLSDIINYNGDCFYGKTRFLINKSFEFGGDEATGDFDLFKERADYNKELFQSSIYKNKYHFGILLEILTENELNHNARCVSNDKTFFDAKGYSIDNYRDIETYVKGNNKQSSVESMLNYGGLSKLSPIFKVGTAKAISDYDEDSMRSSVVVSEKQTADAIADSFKNITFKKAKAFATEYGGMVAIKNLFNNVFIVHRNGVTLHQSNLQVKQTSDSNPITIAQGEILPDNFMKVGSFGSQSKLAVYASDISLYGYDLVLQKAWQSFVDEGGLRQIDMADQYFAKKFWNNAKDSSVINKIILGYDKSRKTILFSFKTVNDYLSTVFFNEEIKAFVSREEFFANRLIGFRNDLLSVKYESVPSSNIIYAHNSNIISDLQSFYGDKKILKFVFVMNGNNSQTNFARTPKIHESLHIISNREPFSAIKFGTEEQEGIYAIFYDESRPDFWNNPIWGENGWHVPILVQTETKNPNVGPIQPNPWPAEIYGYDPKSRQRGMWLLVELKYGGLGGEKEIYIKGVDSRFNISTL